MNPVPVADLEAAAAARATPQLEAIHVQEVYDAIAGHFSDTRYKPWPGVEAFLASLPQSSLVADLGCGNGKYIGSALLSGAAFVLGADVCLPLLMLARLKMERWGGLERPWGKDHCGACESTALYGLARFDVVRLPLRSESVDAVICVAVLHHLSSSARRTEALREVARVLRWGGQALLYAWAKESRPFPASDVLVPWRHRRRGVSYSGEQSCDWCALRFCHVFCQGELEELVALSGLRVVRSYRDGANWCVEVEKACRVEHGLATAELV